MILKANFFSCSCLFLTIATFSQSSAQVLTFGLTAGLDGNQGIQQPYGLVGSYPVDQTPFLSPHIFAQQGCVSCNQPMMHYPSYYPVMAPVNPYGMSVGGYGMPYGTRMEKADGPMKKFWKGTAEGLMMSGLGGILGR